MGRIKILNSSHVELGTIMDTYTAPRTEKINSDNIFNFTAPLAACGSLITGDNIAEVDSDYFDIIAYKKAQASNGELAASVGCEHVSYRLNEPEYNLEYFTQTGTPTAILTALLAGTGFTVGTVDFTTEVTYSAQEAKSRRALLMEFVAYLGGEVEFNQFTIGIRTQRGSAVAKDLLIDRNIEVISISYSKRDKDALGNPLVCYECNLVRPMAIALGDVVTLNYTTLGIDTELRVVSITTDLYHPDDVSFEIGNFVPGLADDAYRIETSTVIKDKIYNGTRIGPEFGFENIRSDKKARSYFNATGGAWQIGDGSGSNWTDKLYIYIDPETGAAKLLFDGELTANVINAIKANIDIVISNTIITQNLYATRGTIAELTVDSLDTSDKVANYLAANTADVNYQKIFDQHFQWITASYKPEQTWTTYPESPVDTADYPYQCIFSAGAATRLIVSTAAWYYYFSGDAQLKTSVAGKMYQLNGTVWEYVSDATNYSYTTILQANADVYNEVGLSSVLFAATHSDHIQLTDRNGSAVYWIDDTHTGTTLEVTEWPVYVYVYDELVKLEIYFDEVDGVQTPIMIWGAGVGNAEHPEYGRGFDFKDTIGRVMRYITSAGVVQDIRNGENGIEFLGDTSNNYYSATNAAEVTVSTTEAVVCTKDIAFSSRSKAIINFSCKVTIATGAANLTGKIYVDGVALTMQPTLYCNSANVFTFSFCDDKKGIAAGTKTIAVKLVTDANSGTVAIGQSKMIVQVFVDPMPSLNNVTGFTATVISDTEIDMAWTNPTSEYFTGIEIYRHSAAITGDRAWCAANATLIYNNTGTSYNDTGLTASTTYYYKIFAVHTVEGTDYYSSGVVGSGTTEEAAVLYQGWSGFPDSPLGAELSTYPYQSITRFSTFYYLNYSENPQWGDASTVYATSGTLKWRSFNNSTGQWNVAENTAEHVANEFIEANNDVYAQSGMTSVYFAKTTP